MPVRVLIVDDSGFFRRRLSEMLGSDPALEVVGQAADGSEALRQVAALRPDVVTMDIEMPVMDGITAVRRIMRSHPTPVLMFSSLTTDGAKATLDALDAGAVDFMPKRFEDISRDRDEVKRQLCHRVRMLGRRGARRAAPAATASPASVAVPRPVAPPLPRARLRRGQISIVAIGTSTGGPVALQRVLTGLPADFRVPLLLVQHMPASFTPAFAQRLNQQCAIAVKEAEDGDRLRPATAYLAPGGRQMLLERHGQEVCIRLRDSEPGQTYRPSVDTTFASVDKVFPGEALAVIMTGMGADGREGVRAMKANGAGVWAQDEKSSVVYGMPAAVVEAGLADQVLALEEIGPGLAQSV